MQCLKKWLEIWCDRSIPNQVTGATSYFTWYVNVATAYFCWMYVEFDRAKSEGTTPPPMYTVAFAEAKMWAHKMKVQSNMAHSTGVINDATTQICTNLDNVLREVDILTMYQKHHSNSLRIFVKGVTAICFTKSKCCKLCARSRSRYSRIIGP